MMTRKAFVLAAAFTTVVLLPLGAVRPVALAAVVAPQQGQPISSAATQRHFQAAMAFRAQLRGWASANRSLLRQLMQGAPQNLLPLKLVYAHLPPYPLSANDPRHALGKGNPLPLMALETPQFDPDHLLRSQDQSALFVKNDYQRYHDLKLASTIGIGPTSYSVWASGRITRTQHVSIFHGHGQPLTEQTTETTIVPPFRFLKG